MTLPGGAERTLMKLGSTCPAHWTAVAPAAGGKLVVYDDARLWRGGREIAGPVDGIGALAFDGKTVVSCAEPKGAEQIVDKDTEAVWKLDGETYRIELDGVMAGSLGRMSALEDGAWKQRLVAPIQLFEGASMPFCTLLEGWPSEGTLTAVRELEPSDAEAWKDAEGDDATALAALAEGTWSVNGAGYAARTEWFEGLRFMAPVAWKPAGGDWALVPELQQEAGTPFVIAGPWLLVQPADGGALARDVRTGEVAWKGAGPAAPGPGGGAPRRRP
ncbi:MAG: hypothetical protein R3F59_18660 [Myxococcota bacterium]